MSIIAKCDSNVINIIRTSFKMTKGFKGTFWGMYIAVGLISITMLLAVAYIYFPNFTTETMQTQEFMAKFKYTSILFLPVTALLITGMEMVSLRYTRGEEVSVKNIFDYTKSIWNLTLIAFIIFVIRQIVIYIFNITTLTLQMDWLATVGIAIGWIINIIFLFSYMLVIDKRVGAIEAMKLSFIAVKKNLCIVLSIGIFFILLLSVIVFSSLLMSISPSLGFILGLAGLLGIIWIAPAMFISLFGLLYRMIFDGVEIDGVQKGGTHFKA